MLIGIATVVTRLMGALFGDEGLFRTTATACPVTAGCPSSREAGRRVQAALGQPGVEAAVEYVPVAIDEEAAAAGFAASPTITVDGRDLSPFPVRFKVWVAGFIARLPGWLAGSVAEPC